MLSPQRTWKRTAGHAWLPVNARLNPLCCPSNSITVCVSTEGSSTPGAGGWAGFGAAKHLSAQGVDVTLLDASPNPGGLSAGWRTKQGRAVEAGVKGFWYQARALGQARCGTLPACPYAYTYHLACCGDDWLVTR